MRKEEIEINGKRIVLMEQPTKFILDLERRHSNKDLIRYVSEILKYPANENPTLEELINIPEEIKWKDLKLPMLKDGKKDLHTAEDLFVSLTGNKLNSAYVAELYLKKLGKKVEDYKYSELVEMGSEVFKQVGEMAYLVKIIEMFRNM